MVQANIFYAGTVQGVGFRYAVHRLASNLDINGWVKNLRDGRVQLVVEGDQNVIEELCKRIDDHFEGQIKSKEIDIQEYKGLFKDFQIIY